MGDYYNYEEFLSEFFDELANGSLTLENIVQVLRSDIPTINGYFPIIDWYYDKDTMELDFAYDARELNLIDESVKNNYYNELPLLENIRLKDCIQEMRSKRNNNLAIAGLIKLFELNSLEIEEIKIMTDKYIVNAKEKSSDVRCVNCNFIDISKHGVRLITVLDVPIANKPVLIKLKRQRYKCKACSRTFLNKNTDLDGRHNTTKRLTQFIMKNILTSTNVKLAEQVGLDESTIRKIVLDYKRRKRINSEIKTPVKLGMNFFRISNTEIVFVGNINEGTIVKILSDIDELFDCIDNLICKENIKTVSVKGDSRLFHIANELIEEAEVSYYNKNSNDLATNIYQEKLNQVFNLINKLVEAGYLNSLLLQDIGSISVHKTISKKWTDKIIDYGIDIDMLLERFVDFENTRGEKDEK